MSYIKIGKIKDIRKPWQRYLKGRNLFLIDHGNKGYTLISIFEQYGEKTLEDLCEYIWEKNNNNAGETITEGYKTLEEFIDAVNRGYTEIKFNRNDIKVCQENE
ncbi:MAG: hypothetical protein LKF87_14560 [Clostridium tyrobutyricum]|jgi:hypothetical protein|uniref:hypothetical protein n=1 Tax=Clostridium tyrobutyricum TaxID=1519 RepID=UPI0011C79C6C|nr:hypothetical protein [Clostridium tyrobutyricum]MCH4200656.1 hypothetical protein [Clostridium tyrobutyricum]MCH4237554.1 hypothetical protein [Clostridium tyrobutyricum]MCH4260135.1 hypothetical protein [Clostridium tyrobutyricum]MCI2011755.1 hypothetical protein [Clostridium tyrobutyricum]